MSALKRIADAKSTTNEIIPAPGLKCHQSCTQDEEGHVEGGFTTFIVMDRVPGRSLDPKVFCSYQEDYKDLIRFEFKRSLR